MIHLPLSGACRRLVPRALLCVGGSLLLVLSPLQAQEPVSWARVDSVCTARSASTLTCGEFGQYEFGASARSPGCLPVASGTAQPLVLAPDVSSNEMPGRSAFDNPSRAGLVDDIPIVDFFTGSHGFWVNKVARWSSNHESFLYFEFLETTKVPALEDIPDASDLHFLESLCGIADDHQWDLLPQVINMSFGRLLDEEPCATPDSIPCELSKLMAFLHNERGIALVAAAGNHDELLFPASDPSTIAVGMLDMTDFSQNGLSSVPTRATPGGFDALIPGSGLALIDEEADLYQPVSPGSSFSAAFLSGWLTRWEDRSPGSLASWFAMGEAGRPLSVVWAQDGFYLAANGTPFLDSRFDHIDDMLSIALGFDDTVFEVQSYPDPAHSVTVSKTALVDELPISRQELMRETNLPTPGSEFCVPCRMRRHSGRSPVGLEEGMTQMVIETGTRHMPGGVRLDDVELSVDGERHALFGADYAATVSAIADGHDFTLELSIPDSLLDGRSLALVYKSTRLVDDRAFFDEVPITIHVDPPERLFVANFEHGDLRFWSAASSGTTHR